MIVSCISSINKGSTKTDLHEKCSFGVCLLGTLWLHLIFLEKITQRPTYLDRDVFEAISNQLVSFGELIVRLTFLP